MEAKSDFDLLREYSQKADDAAFNEIVNRYADLVYASAMRQVNSPELAKDIAQVVFTDLARKAKAMSDAPGTFSSLAGWLYQATRLEALAKLRSEIRRQERERKVMEDFSPLADATCEWEQIRPVLDEAMEKLDCEDREAVLLRFFKNQDYREIGCALKVSDDAAQKRVSRALERLRNQLLSRGVAIGAATLAGDIAVNAVPAGPLGLAATISTAALAGTAVSSTTLTAVAAKNILMTALQKTCIAITIAAAVGTGMYQAHRASKLNAELRDLQSASEARRADAARSDATNENSSGLLAALREENEQLRRAGADLPRLRGEVASLRQQLKDATRSKSNTDTTEAAAAEWADRVKELKAKLDSKPEAKIPELRLLGDNDWLMAASGKLESDKDYRQAFSSLRHSAENKLIVKMQPALKKYMAANNNQFPSDILQLQGYFDEPVDVSALQRYTIIPAEQMPSLKMGGSSIITQKSPVDEEYDSRWGLGSSGFGSSGSGSWNDQDAKAINTLGPVMKAFADANGGREPVEPSELAPYLTTQEQKVAFDRLQKRHAAQAH